MAAIGESAETKGAVKSKIPFRRRFEAWWNGYELVAREAESDQGPPEDAPKLQYEPSDEHWSLGRIDLVQQVWGEGLTGPGGKERILELVKPLALNPAMSLLELGAGLGGAARIVADHFGVWVTGFEADARLVEAGMAISTQAGFAKKAPVQSFDPEHFEAKPKSCDALFSKEFLFTVQDKDRLFRLFNTMLKDDGQILLTDYVLAEPGKSSPALDAWAKSEPAKPAPWALEDYVKVLTELKLDIRITEDITEDTRKLITEDWGRYMASVNHDGLDNASISAMVDEAELWTRRVKLLESGDLKVCRIHALKKMRDSLLSDW